MRPNDVARGRTRCRSTPGHGRPPYAVAFRYAGIEPDLERIDREGALSLIEALLNEVGRELAEAESG